MSGEDHGAHDHSKAYLGVLVGLLILTMITVGVSRVDFGGRAPNIVIGVLIAVIKASLVVLIFMHLKYENRWWAGIILFPLALVMIILFSNFPDTALNGTEGDGEMTTPAVERIPHAGQPGAPAGGAPH
jgi:cytochrome c oxidase subunit 4